MRSKLLVLMPLFLVLTACTTVTPLLQSRRITPEQASDAWAKVLERHVREDGRVDFEGLQTDMGDLTVVVRFLANLHLEEFPDPVARTAALINGYNALALYNVIMTEQPEDLQGWFARSRFFKWRKYVILGEYRSLRELRDMILEQAGDRRVLFAMASPDAGAPRLRSEPYTGSHLQTQLDDQARRFVNEPRNIWVDEEKKNAHISEVLRDTGDPMVFINRYRELKVPNAYALKTIPRDWTIYKSE